MILAEIFLAASVAAVVDSAWVEAVSVVSSAWVSASDVFILP